MGQVTVSTARPFTSWMLIPPSPARGTSFQEPPTLDLIWKWMALPANDPRQGRDLFSGTVAQQNALWREFRNYIRQARAYDDASRGVQGSSAALLLYYALLNLAKAELLTHSPASILGQPIRHGLLFKRGTGQSIAGDAVEVTAGVFPLLYQKRTGTPLALGTRIPVKRLLTQIPEIGWEVERCQFGPSKAAYLLHAAVSNAQSVWALIAVARLAMVTQSAVSARTFHRAFEPIAHPSDWREIFAVTRRFFGGGFELFQSRGVLPRQDPSAPESFDEYGSVAANTWEQLQAIVDFSVDSSYDALLCPSLYSSRLLSMPASLARYALMFYVSSLVRYAPSKLDPSTQANQAWLLDSFAHESHIPVLCNSLNGISGQHHFFYERGAFRL